MHTVGIGSSNGYFLDVVIIDIVIVVIIEIIIMFFVWNTYCRHSGMVYCLKCDNLLLESDHESAKESITCFWKHAKKRVYHIQIIACYVCNVQKKVML